MIQKDAKMIQNDTNRNQMITETHDNQIKRDDSPTKSLIEITPGFSHQDHNTNTLQDTPKEVYPTQNPPVRMQNIEETHQIHSNI